MTLGFVLQLLLLIQNILADEGVNFAFGKPTWQSSTNGGGVSSRAVDGYKHPDYSQNSCMQTNTQHEPWWLVDLEQEVFVKTVRITNRADCCWENLINFDIRVGTNSTDGGKSNAQCGSTYIYSVGAGKTLSITCMPPVPGRYVSVFIADASGTLNFCEVEVYGYQRHNVFSVKATSHGSQDVSDGKNSRLIVDDINIRLSPRGHHVISFNITTGQKLAHGRFDTQGDSSVSTRMPQYLQNLPSEIFVFVILQNGGWNYYHTSIPILQSLSGSSHISDQLRWGDAWSLLGYKGKLPWPSWTNSVMKNLGHTPAVIEDVIPKLLVPPHSPSSVIVVDLTSSSFILRWSRPPGIVKENELPLEYIICVRESGTVIESCKNNGNSQLFTSTSLNPQTEYDVSVKAQSFAGLGPEAVVHVTTMDPGKYKIYVELVSRVEPDTLYRLDAQSYSSINIRGQQHNFAQAGHHFIVLDPKTGSEITRGSFDTNQDPSSSTKMAEFLSSIPKPSIILMVVYYQAHSYYTGDSLRSVCPNAPLNYTSMESWSMTCLYGFGTMSWVTSLTSNGSKGPAVIKTHILLLQELQNAPVLFNVFPVSSRSLELHWTVPDTNEYTGEIFYYQICYKKSNVHNNVNCSLQSVAGNLTKATVSGLHPFQEYRVAIRGVVALGYGPYSNVLMSTTPESEPSTGPSAINFLRVSSSSMFVTWSMPEEQNRNGIIRQYSLCYYAVRNTDSCDDVTITDNTYFELNGLKPYQKITVEIKAATAVGFGPATIANQRTLPSVPDGPPTEARVTHADSRNMSLVWQPPALELRNGEIVNYTICIRFFSTSPGPCLQEVTLGNQTHYKATQLKPYTEYIITIFAGTEIGFGPPVMVVNTTSEAEPSGPPTGLQVTAFTRHRIDFKWSPPDISDMNGVLTEFSVCIRIQISNFSSPCQHSVVVPSTQSSHMFSDLRPYVNYSIEVKAATTAGFGPEAKIFQRTAQSEPSGPPTKRSVTFVNGSVISFSWSPPELELRNGVITYYTLCIREYGPESICTRATQVSASDGNSFTYGNLNPTKEYVVAIKAATIVGLGPVAFIQKTSGVCDLPVLHRVNDDGFSASGFLGRNYEPYQARIDNYIPWCDRGNRKNAYIQVDFGGPLKVLGVATKGHRKHWQSWITSYKVSYSVNSIDWKYVYVSEKMVIDGNNGDGRPVQHFLDQPVRTRFLRFEVHTFVGLHPCMGIEVYGCAPAVKPEIERFIASAEALRVFWHRLPSEVDNGKIFGYKICCKSSSSLTPCENAVYVSERATSATVRDLIPFTDYTVEISAGTVAGYGPPSLLEAKTGEASPSGPPHLVMAQDITATSLNLVWSPPEERHRNGIITEYGVCYQEASLGTSCENTVRVPMEQLSYRITTGLRPNTEFMFIVKAATSRGWGPNAVIYETTLPAAPSGPPTSVHVARIGPRILQMFWQPPEAKKQNGDIIGYRACIKEKSFTTPCRKYVTLPETQLMHTMDKLKPYTMYIIHVEAKNALGYGPAKYLDFQTGEAAPEAPPKDVAIRYVSANSVEIMWSPPDKISQNGVIVLYEAIVYQEMANSKVKKIRSSIMRANTTLWIVHDLSPLTDYIFHIKAGTVEGFGPAVIIHKRSDGRIGETGFFSDGKLTAGGIAGGSVMLVALILGIVFSILWNKGMLPHTRTRKLKLASEEKQRRRRKRKRRRRRRRNSRRNSESAAPAPKVHATDSIYSELNDYDAPKQKRQGYITAENLYGTAAENIYSTGIYAPVTTAINEAIYGNPVATTMQQDIYSNPQTEMNIYGTARPDFNRNSLQLRTNLPPVVPRPSVLPPIIPLDATPLSIASNTTAFGIQQQVAGNQIAQNTTSNFVIPQPSQFSPITSTLNAGAATKIDTTSSGNNPVSSIPKPTGTPPFTVPSINHHPNMETDLTGVTLSDDQQATNNIPAFRELIPAPIAHQPSIPVPKFSKKRKSTTVPTAE